jgi:hypothetical protein
MGYKKIDKSLDFADLVLASSLKHNRSLKFTPLNDFCKSSVNFFH